MEDQVLSVYFHAVQIKELRYSVTLVNCTLNRCHYHLRCHIITVGEFNAFTNLECPCFSVFAVLPAFCQTRNDLTFFIEFSKALTDSITGNNPAEVLLCRLQSISKACYTDGDLFCICCVSYGCHGKCHCTCKCYC